MPKGSLACREFATPPTRGRRRLARRPPPARGCGRQRCASARRPCAPTRAGKDDRRAASHVQLHDRAHFDRTPDLKDGAALGELDGVGEIFRLDQAEAANEILGLGVGTVGDDLLVALDHHAGAFQRMSELLEMAARAELLEPGGPFLQLLLPLLGRLGCIPAAAIQIGKFAHVFPPRFGMSNSSTTFGGARCRQSFFYSCFSWSPPASPAKNDELTAMLEDEQHIEWSRPIT